MNLPSFLIRKTKHYPIWFVLLAFVAYGAYVFWPRQANVLGGVPELQQENLYTQTAHILTNPGFSLAYSEWAANALWVAYYLPSNQNKGFGRRPQFSPDWRSLHHVTAGDFRHSGYDRGHLAPNYAIGRTYGRSAQLATFLMTNISPQRPGLNQKYWQRLEEAVIDHFVPRFDGVWVVTGPVFDNRRQCLKGCLWSEKKGLNLKGTWIEVPDAFYKILIGIKNGQAVTSLAFLVPQRVKRKAPLSQYLTTIDAIEVLTGINFFPQWSDQLEEKLESQSYPKDWDLQAIDRRPGRYE